VSLWTDNNEMDTDIISYSERKNQYKDNTDQMVAENSAPYGDEEEDEVIIWMLQKEISTLS
jgi:hypothetical protein